MFDMVYCRIDVNQITPAKWSGDSTAKNAIVEARHHLQGLILNLAHAQNRKASAKSRPHALRPSPQYWSELERLYALININKQV